MAKEGIALVEIDLLGNDIIHNKFHIKLPCSLSFWGIAITKLFAKQLSANDLLPCDVSAELLRPPSHASSDLIDNNSFIRPHITLAANEMISFSLIHATLW